VDDIELILFESHDDTNIPDTRQSAALGSLAAQYACTYTVHLPTDRLLSDRDPQRRKDTRRIIDRIVNATAALSPYAYVLHCDGIAPDATARRRREWYARCKKGIEAVVAGTGIDPSLVCVENLGYPWQWHAALVEETGCSLCCDVGHLWAAECSDWQEQVQRMLCAARVVHLHGVSPRRDHASLTHMDDDTVSRLLSLLRDYRHVITLEVFSPQDVYGSLNTVRRLWRD
jgi:sugar phosphate isomerase/epimerase